MGVRGVKDIKNENTTNVKNVIDTILNEIRGGVFKPGDKLPSQRELVQRMGVGVGSVREALQALKSLNIITIRNGKGAFVSDLEYSTYFNPGRLTICNTREDFRDLLEFRHIYELAAAETAMLKMEEAEFSKLDEIVDEMRKFWPDRNQLIRLDVLFHETLCSFTKNRMVEGIFRNSIALYFELFSLTIKEGYEDIGMIDRHRHIVYAMRKKDRELLKHAFGELIDTTFQELMSSFPE
jgi:GntR family transcriptional repressor for pyruvate dehydrogenase complex